MDREYFYDAKFIGIAPIKIYQIKMDDIKKLSHYIVSNFGKFFVNFDDVHDVGFYLDSLDSFLDNNNNPYYETYHLVTTFPLGRSFLCTCVSLLLFENKANESSLNEIEIDNYKKMKETYNNQITFSNEYYGELYKKGKIK